MSKYDYLKEYAREAADYSIKIRHDIHRHPELSGNEVRTAQLVCSELEKMGIEYQLMDDIHAVVGIIRSGRPGKTVALRGDMDALPINEQTGIPFASEVPNVMHACGHDVHTSALLGAARVLNQNKDKFSGNVKLFFQPSEESDGGAVPMIERGCMEDPHVDGAFAFHVAPSIPAGKLGGKKGYINACIDDVCIDIFGKSCHGAHPEGGIDAIFIAAQVITALYGLRTRRVAGTDPMVLTVGKIEGGTASNIVCDHVKLRITLRTIKSETRERFRQEMTEAVDGICRAFGGHAEIKVNPGFINQYNESAVYDMFSALAEDLFGPECLCEYEDPSLGGEDFSYFGQNITSLMYDLGTGNLEGHENMPLHSCHFTVDETAFYYGILMNSALAIEFLCNYS